MPDNPTIEIRAAGELRAEGKKLVGYAAVFDKRSNPLPFVEVFRPGAFTKTLADGDDVRALREHNPGMLIGRSSAGTLRLKEDRFGLLAEIDPPATQLGEETVELVRRGDLRQMSIAFEAIDDIWGTEDGETFREVRTAKLFDVSIVAYPAYPDTTVAARRMELWKRSGDEYAAAIASASRGRRIFLDQTRPRV